MSSRAVLRCVSSSIRVLYCAEHVHDWKYNRDHAAPAGHRGRAEGATNDEGHARAHPRAGERQIGRQPREITVARVMNLADTVAIPTVSSLESSSSPSPCLYVCSRVCEQVENMSHFTCDLGTRYFPFGRLDKQLLHQQLSLEGSGDSGVPMVSFPLSSAMSQGGNGGVEEGRGGAESRKLQCSLCGTICFCIASHILLQTNNCCYYQSTATSSVLKNLLAL